MDQADRYRCTSPGCDCEVTLTRESSPIPSQRCSCGHEMQNVHQPLAAPATASPER